MENPNAIFNMGYYDLADRIDIKEYSFIVNRFGSIDKFLLYYKQTTLESNKYLSVSEFIKEHGFLN